MNVLYWNKKQPRLYKSEETTMKRAYINGILLDGTQHMEPQAHKVLLC